MTVRCPGCAYLSARATLENPRVSANCVVFDALIPYTPASEENPNITCSFHYVRRLGDVTEEVPPGSYDIFAKVVNFEPNMHPRSPVRHDDDFVLMGDLLDIRPLPVGTDDNPLAAWATPPRLTVSGRVSIVHSDLRSFSVNVSQIVRGGTPHARLPVRGIMGLNPMWPRPHRRLPAPNSTVAFSGDIILLTKTCALSIKKQRPPKCISKNKRGGPEGPSEFLVQKEKKKKTSKSRWSVGSAGRGKRFHILGFDNPLYLLTVHKRTTPPLLLSFRPSRCNVILLPAVVDITEAAASRGPWSRNCSAWAPGHATAPPRPAPPSKQHTRCSTVHQRRLQTMTTSNNGNATTATRHRNTDKGGVVPRRRRGDSSDDEQGRPATTTTMGRPYGNRNDDGDDCAATTMMQRGNGDDNDNDGCSAAIAATTTKGWSRQMVSPVVASRYFIIQ
ncbi:hypothetical protein EDB84DRAFT_1444221 [Lactarius hengduanensis]|nr:hypothetical protein EDB84DRAFT_1444221 [Lactarius hengduanensis]